MMTHITNADELNAQAKRAAPEELLGRAGGQSTVLYESDDGVEALIVFMDATTLEYVFLQAQRQTQREAAKALGDAHRRA
jgi:hypothetical protein